MSWHTFIRLVYWWDLYNLYCWGPLFLLWLALTLLQKIVSYIGCSGMRARNGQLETAIITYEHPRSGRKVVCVGMIHIGQSEYFRELQKRIDTWSARGYRILYEGVGIVTDQERAQMTSREQACANGMVTLRDTMKRWANSLRLTYQMDGIVYRPDWIRTDVERVPFARSLAACDLNFGKLGLDAPTSLPTPYQALMDMQMQKGLATFPFAALVMNLVPSVGKIGRVVQLILHSCNAIALRGIRSYPGDVVTMWGAGHLWGIGNGLELDGFRRTTTEWIPVFAFRQYSWRQSLAITCRAFWHFVKAPA